MIKNAWGEGDYKDIMAGVDHLIAQGIADPDRLGVMGGSYRERHTVPRTKADALNQGIKGTGELSVPKRDPRDVDGLV